MHMEKTTCRVLEWISMEMFFLSWSWVGLRSCVLDRRSLEMNEKMKGKERCEKRWKRRKGAKKKVKRGEKGKQLGPLWIKSQIYLHLMSHSISFIRKRKMKKNYQLCIDRKSGICVHDNKTYHPVLLNITEPGDLWFLLRFLDELARL